MDLANTLEIDGQWAISLLIALLIALGFVNSRTNSIMVGIMNRWARWLCVSGSLAFLVYKMEWADRPFWSLAIIFFLFWLLIETFYTWLAISAMSLGSLNLFPQFRSNSTGEEWPAQKTLIDLRAWLKKNHFKKRQALLADIGDGVDIRSSIYQDDTGSIRAQILFIPQATGLVSHCLSFTSETKAGERLITDNMNTPYGGFYPENWSVIRKPWSRSAEKLLKVHRNRIQDLDLDLYEIDPLDDINQQQGVLERINIQAGFLFPPHLHEEMGRITWEGRYRVWKEVWLLNYFGVTGSS